jgi:hypothetical protein
MTVTKKQFSLGLVIAAVVCAGVYAIGGRTAVERPTETVRPAAQRDPQEPREPSELHIVGPVPSYWAKTSDFDGAPATAQRDSEAPAYVPPPVYPLQSNSTEPITAVDPVTAQLPGGAVPEIQIELPAKEPGDPE